MYSDLAGKLWYKHSPQVVGKVEVGSPPKAGDLAPHPMGAVWSRSLLELYGMMAEGADNIVPTFYYYPLLARHCSDANLEGKNSVNSSDSKLI